MLQDRGFAEIQVTTVNIYLKCKEYLGKLS
jgi:hypothetical protein